MNYCLSYPQNAHIIFFFSAISQTHHAESTYKPKWKNSDFESQVRLITDKNHVVAYCHVPKAASTTWMVAFAKNNHVDNYTELLEKLSNQKQCFYIN